MVETSKIKLTAIGIALALAGGVAGWFWQSHSVAGGDRIAIEKVVHDYILAHPEILPEAMENLRKNENAKQLAGVDGALGKPFPGAVLGNPQGKVTLIEFTDYACTYCRKSVEDVEQLIAQNPNLRVVVRELPILSPASADAARMGLAAAEQGKYPAFHRAMFEIGHPDASTIAAAAQSAGLDMARANRIMADPRIETEISANLDLARQLGFNGTPSWVIGKELLSGAVGKEALAKAISEASS
jgi:protein-disulfide isomerase